MREYSKVAPALWRSQRFMGLPSDDCRYLYLYLLTNQHQTSAGCYELPPGYARVDLAWPMAKVAECMAAVQKAEMIQSDEATNEILIVKWFKHNPPMNPSHRTGTERHARRIQSAALRDATLEGLQSAWEETASASVARNKVQPLYSPSSLRNGRG